MSNFSKRITNWFFYNFCFAILPLIASVTVHYLANKPLKDAFINSSEILFFVIMTAAIALGSLSEKEVVSAMGWDVWIKILRQFFILGIIGATFLYGVLLSVNIINPELTLVRIRLLTISFPMAGLFFIFGLVVEVVIGKTEDRRAS